MGKTREEQQKFITLKEASRMTGYTSDYLGQLIRKGKLAGKQVYLNVAWVTTEEAIKEYFEKNKGGATARGSLKSAVRGGLRRWAVRHNSGEEAIRIARRVLYVVVVIMIAICVFLGYALVANILRATGI